MLTKKLENKEIHVPKTRQINILTTNIAAKESKDSANELSDFIMTVKQCNCSKTYTKKDGGGGENF